MKKRKNLPEKDFGVAEMFKKKTVHQKKKKPILDERHKKKRINRLIGILEKKLKNE